MPSTSTSKKGLEEWERANIPERHKDFKIEHNENEQWAAAFESIRPNLGYGGIYVIIGNRGTGKTQMAICLIREACKKGMDCRYSKVLDIFIDLRESFKVDGATESGTIKKYVKYDLLVIDAMENRGETEFENRLLNHIIDKRYDACKDTIMITNQTDEAFKESVGASVISRIIQTGQKVTCNWDTFRRRPVLQGAARSK